MATQQQIERDIQGYAWGSGLRGETRQRLIDDIREGGEWSETFPELQEMSDDSLFLVWLRS